MLRNLFDRGRKLRDGGLSCRRGRVAPPAVADDFQIRLAFFSNADPCGFPFDAGEDSADYGAALVEDSGGPDVLLFKPFDNIRTGRSARFFFARKGEVDGTFRREAAANQKLGGFENRRQRPLRIQRSAPPDTAVPGPQMEPSLISPENGSPLQPSPGGTTS